MRGDGVGCWVGGDYYYYEGVTTHSSDLAAFSAWLGGIRLPEWRLCASHSPSNSSAPKLTPCPALGSTRPLLYPPSTSIAWEIKLRCLLMNLPVAHRHGHHRCCCAGSGLKMLFSHLRGGILRDLGQPVSELREPQLYI